MYSFLVYYFILLVCGVCTWISHYYMNKLESKGKFEKISTEEEILILDRKIKYDKI